MDETSTRRDALLLGVTLLAACAAGPQAPAAQSASTGGAGLEVPWTEIEGQAGGRLGVFVVDTGTGRALGHREDERFPMCSTFKWALAAAVLARVDRAEMALAERVPYKEADLLEHAPATRSRLSDGSMTIEALAGAAVTVSDNTAANLLLDRVGGPDGLTQFFRRLGDPVTRLDRNEPALNLNQPGDLRDTTSPRSMAGLLRAVLCGDALSPASRERLLGWMRACETGRNRLRAGLPAGWVIGDKTGTGRHGAVNDVAIAVPPGRAPILVAAYSSDSDAETGRLEATLAAVARLVVARLA
jgi:beta-lactamase class A